MYDRWDNEESARREAGKKFHFYWQKFHWMRTHALYFFGIMAACLVGLVWVPAGFVNLVYGVGFAAMFAWSGIQIYYARKMKENYRRWGGSDGGGGRRVQSPPGGGQSPEIYGN
jgi:hypothetical protein